MIPRLTGVICKKEMAQVGQGPLPLSMQSGHVLFKFVDSGSTFKCWGCANRVSHAVSNSYQKSKNHKVIYGIIKSMHPKEYKRRVIPKPGPRRSIVPTHSTKIAKASGLEGRPITHSLSVVSK